MENEVTKEEGIQVDPLYVGLTRPATVMGITYAGFVVEIISVAFVFLATANPLWLLLMLPIHAFLYLVSAQDTARIANWLLAVITTGRCLNRSYWKAASFSPRNIVAHEDKKAKR